MAALKAEAPRAAVDVHWKPFVIDANTARDGEDYAASVRRRLFFQSSLGSRSFSLSLSRVRQDTPFVLGRRYNERRWGGDGWTAPLRRKGAAVGAPFADWRTWPNTMRAHALLRFAPRGPGAARARGDPKKKKRLPRFEKEASLKRALFEAIYERGENASDVETLCRIATDCGVDAAAFRRVVDTRAAEDDVRRCCDEARARGVGGVPFFILHGSEAKEPIGFSGAVGPDELLAMFRELL